MEKRFRGNLVLTPLVQIVHVSDLHFLSIEGEILSRKNADENVLLAIASKIPRLKRLKDMWAQGTAGHDPLAPKYFLRFLKEKVVNQNVWNNCPIWVVDTGDLTTYGDDNSFVDGNNFLENLKRLDKRIGCLSIHGNHDTWPNRQPLFARPGTITPHRELLRNKWYKNSYPENPLTLKLPNNRGSIELYTLNSPLHERIRNALAFGEVYKDKHWDKQKRDLQLDQLRRLVENNIGEKSLRILAMHHPIPLDAYEDNKLGMVLQNHVQVASSLSGKTQNLIESAQIILSGHTHRCWPKQLPSHAQDCAHPPLNKGQCQMVVGSLFQEEAGTSASLKLDTMQQFQVLRIYLNEDDKDSVVVERNIVIRTNNAGPFRFVDDSGMGAELNRSSIQFTMN